MVSKIYVGKIVFSNKKPKDGKKFKPSDSSNGWAKTGTIITSCCLPFWSGSLNYGFDKWGLFFSIAKLSSITLYTFSIIQSETYYGLNRKKQKTWESISAGSIISFFILTISDIFYSKDKVSIPKMKKNVSLKRKSNLNPQFKISPRIGTLNANENYSYHPIGLDLSLTFVF